MILQKMRHVIAGAFWLLGTCVACAGDPDFGSGPYPYRIKDQALAAVIQEFCVNTNYKGYVSPALNGKVTGQLPTSSPRDFLNALALQYGFDWYYDGIDLYFTARSETLTRFLLLDGISAATLLSELERQGLTNDRYTTKLAPGGRFVAVTGPPRYVEVVGQTLLALSTGADLSSAKLNTKPTLAPLTVFRGGLISILRFGRPE